ncbi:serine/arginine repetitive matrix protein 1-like [Leptidea sinapis]|uniref:serine/arginine repetitive matrix protein 1-like n=1 Tax=Leptidea sinapis TaxID=189913 RepID=UPI0021C26866|nr:serine/arginine repetitive matrix protein 1-like [Leptidea sinapis]
MLGARFKSWMEAQLGRARKRKSKPARAPSPAPLTGSAPPAQLSSPESAYSTGYSTDGTSPGLAPAPLAAPLVAPPPPPTPPTTHLYHEPAKRRSSVTARKYIPEPQVCATPSPRPRCRIRTNPWLGKTSPNARRKAPHLLQQQSLQIPQPPPVLHHAPYSLDSHVLYSQRSPRLSSHLSSHLSPHLSPNLSPHRTPYVSPNISPHISPYRSFNYKTGASSDEDYRALRRVGPRGQETAILSDADGYSDGDTGLDGGDEDEPDSTSSPGRRRARRRRPPRRVPRSAGATPPRLRRRHAPSAPPVRERDPLLEADREAEKKYRELIREAEKLLVSVSRAPLEPPHNPRVVELRNTEVDCPRRSPERTHITNFIRANSPEASRRLSPAPRRSPLAAPPFPRTLQPPSPTDRPHSEPPKRKMYAREEVLQTLEGLRKSLQQQSALLAVQRTRLDSL